MKAAISAVVLTLVATACASGNGGAPGANASRPAATASATTPAATTSPGGSSGRSTPASRNAASDPARPTTVTPAPLGTSAGGRVTLGRLCVHRGDAAEPQTLTVIAGAGESVGYSTYYSDNSSELNRKDYTAGYGFGPAGPDGRFRASWTVPAGATPGRATVRVIATDMTEDAQEASFLVVRSGEACP